ncbi:spore germination protein [Ureibacillus sp. NPDC094379]
MRRSLFKRAFKRSPNQQYEHDTQESQESEIEFNIPIGLSLKENIENIKKRLGDPSDLIIRNLTILTKNHKCSILYISGLTDKKLVNDNILKMMQSPTEQSDSEASQSASNQSGTDILETIYQQVIAITDTKKVQTLYEVINALLSGNAVFILEEVNTALVMETVGSEERSIEEPQSEAVVRGPRTGFIESIDTNITLIRRELKDPNLRFDVHEIGRRSKQKLIVCSVAGIVNPDILNEVNRRVKTIDIDFSPDSGYVEQWIEDSFLSPFPQIMDTERPDRVIYSVLQGKVAILVDGSPFALIAPVTFGDALQSIEDYSQRWMIGTLLRLLRYLAIFISLFLPAIYVALTSYHPGMLPTKLAFSIAATREGVPIPSIFEALLMAITFEILQEAGIRLPKAIGATIGIVGGIVIGDVAVSAGIVGPAMVIVTSLTAIASFTTPNYSFATGLRVLRFALIAAASVLGLYGIILVFIMMCIHLVNLKSIGVPYTGPFAPYFLGDLKNILIRSPIMTLKKRPPSLEPRDIKRQDDGGQ